MKTINKIIIPAILVITTLLTISSCKKKQIDEKGNLTIEMTDAPANYLAVNVEVIGVSVHLDNSGWVDLPTNAGVYNLLTLQNNVTTVLASNVSLPIGKISQVRLHLGSNNTVVTPGGQFSMETPSAEESGLKINVDETIVNNQQVVIVLDFDANASVVETGKGGYSLKPVIKVKSVTQI